MDDKNNVLAVMMPDCREDIDSDNLITGLLKKEIDVHLDTIKEDEEDLVIVIDGKEGSGKSKLARQLGYYCAYRMGTVFGMNNIHFGLIEYIKSCRDTENKNIVGQVHLLDESRNILSRRKALGKELNGFTDYMSECRAIQGIHILCVPASHDIDKNITMWRMKFLIHCIKEFVKDEKRSSGYKLQRGDYCLFMPDDMANYYYNPQKNGYYKYPRRMMRDGHYCEDGRFKNIEVLKDIQLYKNKKFEAMGDKYGWITEEVEVKQNPDLVLKQMQDRLIGQVSQQLRKEGLLTKQIAKVMMITPSQVTKSINKVERLEEATP